MFTNSLYQKLESGLSQKPQALCTGISTYTVDGQTILGRTIESEVGILESTYTVVPRGHEYRTLLKESPVGGANIKAKFGFLGISIKDERFICEGINEAGLSAGFFFFPNTGRYDDYSPENRGFSVPDLELVSYILANFSTIKEVKAGLSKISILKLDPQLPNLHFRIMEASGYQIILEVINKELVYHENKLGVITNAPEFDWHYKNLYNYVNLNPGAASEVGLGVNTLLAFSAGHGFLGLPGDATSPSRFVRAAFYCNNSPVQGSCKDAVNLAFHILNSFDTPLAAVYPYKKAPKKLVSATLWTSVTDVKNRRLYYRTMQNSEVRCFDLKTIDFENVAYGNYPLETSKEMPVTMVEIK